MAFLLDHLPPRLHLVIAGRADPPLPLARLRARGELVEIRAADLRFTPEEAVAYLNEVMGLRADRGRTWPRWRAAPRAGSPRCSWRHCRCGVGTTSPASSPASRETRATSSTTWSRRCCSVSPSRSRPSCCRPPSWTGSAVRCAMPSRARTAARPCWRRSTGATCSWSRSTTDAGGTATTTSSPTCCAPGCRTSSPTSSRRCTGGRATGTSRTANEPSPSTTPWPPRTSSARRTWSSWRCPRCAGTGARRQRGAGSRCSPRTSSATGPCSASTSSAILLSTGELDGVEPRLRDAERWLDVTRRRASDRGPRRPRWSCWTRRSSAGCPAGWPSTARRRPCSPATRTPR